MGKMEAIEYKYFAPENRKKNNQRDFISSHLFNYVKMFTLSFLGRNLYLFPKRKILFNYDILIFEHALSNIFIYFLAFFGTKPYILWGHGKTYSHLAFSHVETLRRIILKRSSGYFVYTVEGAKYLESLGYPRSQIQILNNSTDVVGLQKAVNKVSRGEIRNFLNKNKIPDSAFRGTFLGTLTREKGIEMLLPVAKKVQKIIPDFQILVFGNGPNVTEIDNLEMRNNGIFYNGIGDISKTALLPFISKFLFIPKGIGLVAVDSFALGLPILTNKDDNYAPEFAYLEPEENCITCEYSVEKFASKIASFFNLKRDFFAVSV